jgi:hypothetical protein
MKTYGILALPGLELRPLGCQARSQSLYRLSYQGSPTWCLTYFIWRLFNDAVNSSDYIASNGRISNDLETIRKGGGRGILQSIGENHEYSQSVSRPRFESGTRQKRQKLSKLARL